MKLKRFFSLFLVIVLSLGVLSGCALLFNFEEYDPDADRDGDVEVEPDYEFVVTCDEETTTITLGKIGYYGDVARLVYLKPYQYLAGEQETGLATEECLNVAPTVIGNYECGTEATITIDRYTSADERDPDFYDTVYCKFYVVDYDGNILDGPKYATEITPKYDHDEVVQVTSIKGVATGATYDIVEDLGCSRVQIGWLLTGMVVPLETVNEENGELTPIEYEEHLDENGEVDYIVGPYGEPQYVEAYWHNGTKYYFRTKSWGGYSNFDGLDEVVSEYTRRGIKVTLIVLVGLDTNQYVQPYQLTYKKAKSAPVRPYYAMNTSNPQGAEYWAALMDYLADRYSQEESKEDAVHGTIETYIMSNEIDQHAAWNVIVDTTKYPVLSLEDYSVEYERMLRITNQSFKKNYARDVALVPITHWWNGSAGGVDYSPRALVDFFCAKARREGNYNWGLAIHPYGSNLAIPNFWSIDTVASNGVTGALSTLRITWTNLEVLQVYLEQENKMCNDEVRDVYVTEGGVSSSSTANGDMSGIDKNYQAAGIAYAYYKASQLPCIKGLNYYQLVDAPIEGAYFGLMTTTWAKKPAYEVYKYIDTQYSFEVSIPYLDYINWTRSGNSYIGSNLGWQGVMGIHPSNFDWNMNWDEDKIITRHLKVEEA